MLPFCCCDVFEFKFNKAGYYKNIEDDNEMLSQVLNILNTSPTKNNTLFVYASDHGISRKWSLYEPGLRVPLIIKWPNIITPNTRTDDRVSLIDILPTFIDLVKEKLSLLLILIFTQSGFLSRETG